MKRWLSMGLIGVALFVSGCGGDSDNGDEELSLTEYFNGLQVLSDEVANRADSLAEPTGFDDDVADAFNQSLDIFHDFLSYVRDIHPPSETQGAHIALVMALDDFIDGNETFLGPLEEASTEAEFSAIFESAPAEIGGSPIGSACEDLQQVATDNDIRIDLDCGGG